MADCSKLSENLAKIAMILSTRDDVKNLDDVVFEMQKFFPEIRRESLIDAIIEHSAKNKKTVDDVQKKVRSIMREPFVDRALQNKIQELDDFLEEGQLPDKKKGGKTTPLSIERLRKTRDALRKWLATSDPAIEKKYSKEIEELTEQLESGDVGITKRTGKLHEEVQEIKDEVDVLRKQIAEQKKEQATEQGLNDTIELLQAHLESGTLPDVKARQQSGTESTRMLRSIIADLRKKLSRSEPARRKRIEKSIADLERKLTTGDILPKIKPELETSKELEKLIFKRDLIRKEIQDEIRSMKPLTFWGRVGAGWDLVRLMMTIGEFSFGLRQGGVYAFTHPLKWTKAMVQSGRAFWSPESLYKINKEIFERENAPLYARAGLPLLHEGMSLTQSEDVIMNYWMDKLPVFKNFNRAAIAFFNTVRADTFDMGYKTLGRTDAMTQVEAEIWANYIAVMSGRGKLSLGPVNLEPAALALNRAFFSARYVASRFQMLTFQPLWTQSKSEGATARVRYMIAKEYIRLGAGLATVFSLALLMGADIEDDPRSTDFGKLKFGNRRLDPLMGFNQVIVFMSRVMTGKTKTGRGNVVSLRGDDKKYGSSDVADIIARFGRSKLSPQFGFIMNLLTGETMIGEEVSLLNTVTQLLYPMTYGDIYDVMQEEGMPTNAALTILVFLGMGLQTYDVNKRAASVGGI